MGQRRQDADDNGYCTSDNDATLDDASNLLKVYKRQHTSTNDRIGGNNGTQFTEVGDEPDESIEIEHTQPQKAYKLEIVWRNVIAFIILHSSALVGLYLLHLKVTWKTFFWIHIVGVSSAMGVTAGAHRLWAHKTYKANLRLRIMLIIFNTMAGQNSVIEWVRDHRVHHKFTETDADPHNSRRGFFFSHIGWLMVKKHPDVKTKGKKVSLDDLYADPWLKFQHKYYWLLVGIFSMVIPTYIPVLCWDEPLIWSFLTAGIFRYVLSLNYTWCINSVAHLYGNRPYDKNMGPRQNVWASILTMGEGFHNYHHKFPRDYRASEYPSSWFNPSKAFIDFFAWIGWAYDLHVTTTDAVLRTKLRHGDVND